MIYRKSIRLFFNLQYFCVRKFCRKCDIRVRFAPSPTGYLHLGGLRTALYNHLFAKSQNGTSIIRIEDTDQSRLVEGATEKLIEDLKWCGIDYDEGPYIQSERKDLYKKHVEILLEKKAAYRCFCSASRLELMRREALKLQEVPKYDNKCRHLTDEEIRIKMSSNEPYCIRFKLPSGMVSFNDAVYGPTEADISSEGDPVIMKSDGFPTYHLANVVDDYLMNISHVLRGCEWQISTFKHLLLYRAFGWNPPEYGHLPLLLNSDGTKLSKRQDDLRVSRLKEEGIFPMALVNFVIRAGGGFQITQIEKDERNFTIQELIERFDFKKVNKNSCKIGMQQLLDDNRIEIKRLMQNENDCKMLIDKVRDIVTKKFDELKNVKSFRLDDNFIRKTLEINKDRIYKLEDLVSDEFSFLWYFKECEIPKDFQVTGRTLEIFYSDVEKLDFDREKIKMFLREFSENHKIEFPKFMKFLRSVFTSLKKGPSVAELMEGFGKENTLTLLKNSIRQMKLHEPEKISKQQ